MTVAANAVLAALTAAAISVVTLMPYSGVSTASVSVCATCEPRVLADAALNVLLFLPLVALLAPLFRVLHVVMGATLMSGIIECLQMFIPGRVGSVADVALNGVGSIIGLLIIRTSAHWIYPEPRSASRACFLAALVATACFGVTGYVLQPILPPTTYFGQWTPVLGHLDTYDGRLVAATIDTLQLPSGQLASSERFRRHFTAGSPLRVTVVAGHPPEALAPIFSVADNFGREIMLIGAYKKHLVFRNRTRATELRLDQPDLRLPSFFRDVVPGDTLRLSVRHARRGVIFNAPDGSLVHAGFSLGLGWALLLFPESLPLWAVSLVSACWVMALALPVGIWARPDGLSLFAVATLVFALAVLPPAIGVQATPLVQWLGCLGGLLAGRAVQRCRTASV